MCLVIYPAKDNKGHFLHVMVCQIFKTICYLSQGESQKIAHEDSDIPIVTTTIIVN